MDSEALPSLRSRVHGISASPSIAMQHYAAMRGPIPLVRPACLFVERHGHPCGQQTNRSATSQVSTLLYARALSTGVDSLTNRVPAPKSVESVARSYSDGVSLIRTAPWELIVARITPLTLLRFF